MDPGAHGEFGDEDVAALCEEDGGLCGDHFDFRVSFHDFFYPRQRQLVDLVVMVVGFEVVDRVLPVGGEDVAGGTGETLADLIGLTC